MILAITESPVAGGEGRCSPLEPLATGDFAFIGSWWNKTQEVAPPAIGILGLSKLTIPESVQVNPDDPTN